MADTKLLLSQLSIDGQLYQLKDSELTSTVSTLATEVETHDTKIYALQQALGGLDARTLASLEKITQELQGTENETTQAFVTLVDKLKGIGSKENPNQTVKDYVTDHVTERITGFGNEIYYKSKVKYVVTANEDENGNISLYDAEHETLTLTTNEQYRLLDSSTGTGYVSE